MKRMIVFLAACALACAAALALASGGESAAFAAGAEPFVLVLWLTGGFAASCFAFGLATGDYSWVDRLWSIVPVLFAWLYAARGGFAQRADVAACLVALWGARLTRNFARRGGYSGSEDYRWSILRGRIPSRLLWQAFNALFICAAQLGVIALFSAPLGRLVRSTGGGSPAAFAAAAVLCLFFIAYETEADREQWEFQERKAAYRAGESEDPEAEAGFRSSGLFRLSRHPAYFGELGFWWGIYLLCAAGSGSLLHWSATGPLALTALFVGSTRFTESLSAAKYPGYDEYRRTTSAILPWFPGRRAAISGEAA